MTGYSMDHHEPRSGALRRLAFVACAAALGLTLGTARAGTAIAADDWIPTWAASPQPVWDADFFAPVSIPRALRDQTLRQVARVSIGGTSLRVVFSNEYGDRPLVIGSASVALAGKDADIVEGSSHALTFGGQSSVTVPAGAPIVSDPVALAVEPLGSVAVSMFFPVITPTTTWHNEGAQTAYVAGPGDRTAEANLHPTASFNSRIFLSEIMVDAPADARAVVTFGDSITDGAASTPNENNRWPDILAERLHAAGAKVAVVNEGISGARVLSDRMGDNALARFDRDVLSQPRADTVIVMMGINDIGWPGTILVPEREAAPTADDIIVGYKQLITRAREHGMKIIGATLTPFAETFKGFPLYGYYNEEKELKREAVNAWIRTPGNFDGVIDFDAVTRDPANPKFIRPEFDSGDHLHPQDAGYKAMADAIDLKLLGVGQ